MLKPRRATPNLPYRLGFFLSLFLFPFGLLYRIWLRSLRIESGDVKFLESLNSSNESAIIALWHNRLFLAGEWHRRFRNNRKCYGLISASRDGAWLEKFYGWSGIKSVRGSRNNKGPEAIRLLAKKLKGDFDVGITPDGSRGPIYEVKPGVVFLAKVTKKPIFILSFEYGINIKLNSWDRFVIPLPFTKIKAHYNIVEFEEINKLSVEAGAELLTKEINKVTNN